MSVGMLNTYADMKVKFIYLQKRLPSSLVLGQLFFLFTMSGREEEQPNCTLRLEAGTHVGASRAATVFANES